MLVKIGFAFVRISQSEEDNGLYHREHGGMLYGVARVAVGRSSTPSEVCSERL